jgi:hypothetical protein
MSCEQFLSLGIDDDDAVMAMDRRTAMEQLKESVKKLIGKKQKWDTLPTINKVIPNLDSEND